MIEFIINVRGPIKINAGEFGSVWGQKVIYYSIFPELDLGDVGFGIMPFGGFYEKFDQQPSQEDLDSRIIQGAAAFLGSGVEIGDQTIPAEQIKITTKHNY